MRWRRLTPLLLLGLLPALLPTASGTASANTDEQTLRTAGLRGDPASLLAFFRARAREASSDQIEALVRRLGDDAFPAREEASRALAALAGRAVPALRRALDAPDPEVRRRADACLRRIADDARPDLVAAAARLLARHRPAGAAAALLDCLPAVADDRAVDALHDALAALAVRDGRADPAVVAALADESPARRAAAGTALARAAEPTPAVRRLLADADPLVRLHVGLALADRGERDALPALVSLLDVLPRNRLWPVEDLLYRLAGGSAPTAAPGRTPEERRAFRAAWGDWYARRGADADMARLRPEPYLDHTLVLLLDEGRAIELGADDRPLWDVAGLDRPLDVQLLPGERLLVAENGANRVTERLRGGTVLWHYAVDGPFVAQRLADGHTFIATRFEMFEVDRDGVRVLSHKRPGPEIMRATRLPDGDVVCVTNGGRGTEQRFVRQNAAGEEIRSFPVRVDTYGGRLDVRPDGRVLVPDHAGDKVVEYDAAGRETARLSAAQPIAAVRLANGNTLLTSMSQCRAVELDPAGKQVWEYRSVLRVNRALRH